MADENNTRARTGDGSGSGVDMLPAFRAEDFEGRALTDQDVREMAPVLVLLLRGFG